MGAFAPLRKWSIDFSSIFFCYYQGIDLKVIANALHENTS